MQDNAAKTEISRRQLQLRRVHTRFTVFKRIVHVFVICGALALAVALTLSFNEYQAQWYRVHLNYPGATLSQQYAQLLRPATIERDTQAINKLLSVLRQEPVVVSATVFDHSGKKLAATKGAMPVVSESMLKTSPVIYLKSIYDDAGEEIGFVQLLFDRELTLSEPATLNQQLYKLIAAALLLAMLIATYLTRGVYKSRRWLVRLLYQRGSSAP